MKKYYSVNGTLNRLPKNKEFIKETIYIKSSGF